MSASSGNIDGQSSLTLSGSRTSVSLQFDGTNFQKIAAGGAVPYAAGFGSYTANHAISANDTTGNIKDSGLAMPAAAGSATVEQVAASGTLSVTAGNSVGCVDSTTTATGATTSMKVVVSPQSPQTNTQWSGYVSASNTVDVHVCTIVALTGSAVTYNWSVIQ